MLLAHAGGRAIGPAPGDDRCAAFFLGGAVRLGRARAVARAYGVVEKQDIDSAVPLPKAKVLR